MFQAQKISKAYHHRQVLDGVSFALPAGACLGVEGENGSGKSTLLGILAQVSPPDSGDIRYQGRSVLKDRKFLRTKLGYVPQNCDLIPGLTAREQLALWQSACGCREPMAGEAAEVLGLQELLPLRIGEMSGGMQRRVSIALALSTSPEILIMDEATTGLDAEYRENLLGYLEAWLQRGGRMVWCSHLPEENRRLCGSVLRIDASQEHLRGNAVKCR